ncbi:hypothetical protein STEG23_023261 [Scotinomys teguina]
MWKLSFRGKTISISKVIPMHPVSGPVPAPTEQQTTGMCNFEKKGFHSSQKQESKRSYSQPGCIGDNSSKPEQLCKGSHNQGHQFSKCVVTWAL